jgi:sulfoquinovose isomerase
LLDDARSLFDAAVREGWSVDDTDGFVYTVDWNGRPVVHERMHWVAAEATATAAALHKATGEPTYADWYQRWWGHIADVFIDRHLGSWRHELDASNQPSGVIWNGKPDTYHALQATLIPRLPLAPTLSTAIRDGHLA